MSQLQGMLQDIGVRPISLERPNYLSRSKLSWLSTIHRVARVIYYKSRELVPSLLGMILMVGIKQGDDSARQARLDFMTMLRCPITKLSLVRDGDELVAIDGRRKLSYPIINGVPVLIKEEAKIVESPSGG